MPESQIDILRKEIDSILKRVGRASSDQEIKALDLYLATRYRAMGTAYMQTSGLDPNQQASQANYYLGMAINQYELYPDFDAEDEIAQIYEQRARILEGLGAVSAEAYYQSAIIHAKTRKSYYEAKLDEFRIRRNLPIPFSSIERKGFSSFTPRARQVLSFAQEEARHLQHDYVGSEHVLLGLLREREGVAAKVLSNLHVELNKIRDGVDFCVGRGDRIVPGEIQLATDAKKAIEFADDEARRLGHPYAGTGHLLLGLVREGQGAAAAVLTALRINLEEVRIQTTAVISQGLKD